MKKYLVLLSAVLSSILLFGCIKENTVLKAGKYQMEVSGEMPAPYVELQENGEYLFTYSFLSSTLNTGKYEVKDNKLILDENAYVFDIKDGKLIFDKDSSKNEVKVYEMETPVSDEAIFSYVK